MRILLLEDDEQRIIGFKTIFKECGITDILITKDTEKAFEAIQNRKFDISFLDNDLASEHYSATKSYGVPIQYGEGRDFVKAIIRSNLQENLGFVFIHSFNFSAAEEMEKLLAERATRIPLDSSVISKIINTIKS